MYLAIVIWGLRSIFLYAVTILTNTKIFHCSSGEIKLWTILESKRNLKEIASTNIGCRPTSLRILDLEQFGPKYIISSTIEEIKDIKPTISRPKAPPRGIVTIEYDNEENEDELEAKSSSENETDEEQKDDISNEDNDTDDLSDTDNSEDSEEEERNPEPAVRLPKSRKHKLQVLKNQEKGNKKQKINNTKKEIKQKFSNKKNKQN